MKPRQPTGTQGARAAPFGRGAPAVDGRKLADVLVGPREELLRASEPLGGLSKGGSRYQEQCGCEEQLRSHVCTLETVSRDSSPSPWMTNQG